MGPTNLPESKRVFLIGSGNLSERVLDHLKTQILKETSCQELIVVSSDTTPEELALRTRPHHDIIVSLNPKSTDSTSRNAETNQEEQKNHLTASNAGLLEERMLIMRNFNLRADAFDDIDLVDDKKTPAHERGGKIPFYRPFIKRRQKR